MTYFEMEASFLVKAESTTITDSENQLYWNKGHSPKHSLPSSLRSAS